MYSALSKLHRPARERAHRAVLSTRQETQGSADQGSMRASAVILFAVVHEQHSLDGVKRTLPGSKSAVSKDLCHIIF